MNSRDEKIRWLHEQKTLVAGVDAAKHVHWIRIVDHMGLEIGKGFSFENTREGFDRLLCALEKAKKQTGATRVVVAIESTSHFWKALARFLTAIGIPVVLVNAYHVKRTKETDDNSPTKNDRKDAFVIADMARQGKFLTCMLPKGPYAELRMLSQARQDKVQKLNVVVNQLHAILDQYFPEFPGLFCTLLGKTPLVALAFSPFPEDVIKYSETELFAAFRLRGVRARKKAIHRLREAAGKSIGVREGIASARLSLGSMLREIQFWREELLQIEAAMEKELPKTGIAEYLLSIPGVGVITTAGFLSEVGDLTQFQDWRQIRKLAGLNLTENSSGMHQGQKRISKRGRSHLRSILYQICLVMIAKNPEFRALYQYFRKRSHNPLSGKEAIIAVVSKLLRVIFTLVTKRKQYDPAHVLGQFRTNQIASAA